jgi:photosystem II stability/assembly factor-like uncharacterized protein
MDEQRFPSERSRRALPLIAVALTAAVLTGLLYVRSAAPQTTAPVSRIPVMSGPYNATYDFISPQVGWAIVVDYDVLGSCRSPDLAECPSSSTFWIFKTTDGTKHWLRQYTGTGQGSEGFLHFYDARNGLAQIGEGTYGTVDGGASWRLIKGPATGYDYTSSPLMFASPTRGWALAYVEGGKSAHRRLFSTTDGGATWTVLPADVPSAANFGQHPAFLESGEGWLGANFVSAPIVYNTADGGASWQAVQIAPQRGEYFTSVALVPGGAVLAVAQGGPDGTRPSSFVSSDRGATWHSLHQIPANGIEDLMFVDATHWWASHAGVIYTTADGGSTWHEVVASGFPDYWSFQTAGVIDTDHGWWAMTSAERSTENGLAMTSDGGAHWKMVNPPQPE